MKLGFIGLGKMGSRMAEKLLREGHRAVLWNRSREPVEELKAKIQNSDSNISIQNVRTAETIEQLVGLLEKPRVIWVMVSAGEATQEVLDEISKYIEKDDIVIDGGNSHYKDSETRCQEFHKRGIRFLGLGVSGGILAATNGYPLMIGGDKTAYEFLEQVFSSLAKPNGGYVYFGEGGAGHFAKMVHNGIEYGMMQALGEGFGVLQRSPYGFDLAQVAKLWQKGTIISGFLLDRTLAVLSKDQKLQDVQGVIAHSGEATWTVEAAIQEQVPVVVIERALQFRQRSENDPDIQNSFAAKLVVSLRHEFGGHEIKKK